jgi:hypothetical protein
MRPPPHSAARLLVVAIVLASLAGGGCANDFALANRETPVHVWLTAPELAAGAGQAITALVYVGGDKVVDGPVAFPPGVPHVAFPVLYVNAGTRTVSAVLGGGAASATKEVKVAGETWIEVVLEGGQVEIRSSDREPRTR